ncbi:unnamed protein product [Phytophthora fragariaefolia]|uniref:Unnamed protein product n=1 Tax=Phytophthora fragariaefolia TaxID=1490495 RepID=A0A9W6XNX3_9STRA|nr:unnamed protein product [Phytophthora fragariaefolia]
MEHCQHSLSLPTNTAASAQERPPGHQDHEGDPIVPEELGPSPAAGAASQYHRNSDIHAGQRLGRATAAGSKSATAQPRCPVSAENTAAALRPPPTFFDEQRISHYHENVF